MPGYGGQGSATLLRVNQQRLLLQQDTNITGRASIAVQLERVPRAAYPWGVSFEIYFTDASGNPANPGAFEVDIQTADLDIDSHYCTINQLNAAANLNSSYVGRIELPSFFAKYVRAYVRTLTNAVYVNVMVTR